VKQQFNTPTVDLPQDKLQRRSAQERKENIDPHWSIQRNRPWLWPDTDRAAPQAIPWRMPCEVTRRATLSNAAFFF